MTTVNRIAVALTFASLAVACSSSARTSSTIGTAGGTLATRSGITLRIPAGAVSSEVEVHLVETQPRDGAMARVEIEPRGLAMAKNASLSFKVSDGNVRLAEVEHGAEGEVRHELEKRRHDDAGEVEVELEHLTEIEMEHGLTCDAACGTGFECDDGVCKAHGEDDAEHAGGDDNGKDDGTAPPPVDDNGGSTTPPPPPVDDHGNHGPGHG